MSSKDGEAVPIKIGPYHFTAVVHHTASGTYLEPVSANGNSIHFHVFEENGIYNVLIRNQYNQNTSAYIFTHGQWRERSLTEAEKRMRFTAEEIRLMKSK